MTRWIGCLVVAVSIAAGVARADSPDVRPAADEAAFSGNLAGLDDRELERRIGFLTGRLEERRSYARWWQNGFTAGWTLGIGIGALQAGLADDHDGQLNGGLTAGKAALGVARLVLDPTPARLGAAPILEIEGEGRAVQEARLRAGEAQLAKVAHRAERRTNWLPHAVNLALNGAAGLTVILWGNPSDAVTQIGVSTIAGEIMIWTDPWKGRKDLEEYRDFISGPVQPSTPRARWGLAPMPGGLAFSLEF